MRIEPKFVKSGDKQQFFYIHFFISLSDVSAIAPLIASRDPILNTS
jgi:hypothetical protein